MPPVCTRRAPTSNVRAENTWKKKGEIDRRSRIERRVRRLRRPLAEQNDRKAELEVECAGADGNLRSKSAVQEQKPASGGSGSRARVKDVTARSRVDVAERGLADGANEPTAALPSSPRALLAAFRAASSAAMASCVLGAFSGRWPPAEVCGPASGDVASMSAIQRESAVPMPQSRSYGGQAANFCVGGKIGRKAGKSGSMPPKRLLAQSKLPGNLRKLGFPDVKLPHSRV